MTTLYAAGPMRSLKSFNFPAFMQAQRDLEAAGFTVINPAQRDVENGFDPTGLDGTEDLSELGFDLRDALAWDLDKIARECDGVATLDGWEASKGASAEVATAHALGLPVRSVAEWVNLPSVGDYIGGISRITGVYRQGVVLEVHDNGEVNIGVAIVKPESVRIIERAKAPEPVIEPAKWDACTVTVADLHERLTAEAKAFASVTALPSGEERVTSATGGSKGRKGAELASIDPLALSVLAEVAGMGARKYSSLNYLNGYDWSLSANAAFRHLLAFLNGEDNDPESGLPHAAHFAWHGLALTSFLVRGIGTDDRVSAFLKKEVC